MLVSTASSEGQGLQTAVAAEMQLTRRRFLSLPCMLRTATRAADRSISAPQQQTSSVADKLFLLDYLGAFRNLLRPFPKPEKCNLPGNGGYEGRVSKSVEYTLCLKYCRDNNKEPCKLCRCEWAAYWEEAQLCFPSNTLGDPLNDTKYVEFKEVILGQKLAWEEFGKRAPCSRQTPEENVWSLDDNDANWCNGAPASATVGAIPLFITAVACLMAAAA